MFWNRQEEPARSRTSRRHIRQAVSAAATAGKPWQFQKCLQTITWRHSIKINVVHRVFYPKQVSLPWLQITSVSLPPCFTAITFSSAGVDPIVSNAFVHYGCAVCTSPCPPIRNYRNGSWWVPAARRKCPVCFITVAWPVSNAPAFEFSSLPLVGNAAI